MKEKIKLKKGEVSTEPTSPTFIPGLGRKFQLKPKSLADPILICQACLIRRNGYYWIIAHIHWTSARSLWMCLRGGAAWRRCYSSTITNTWSNTVCAARINISVSKRHDSGNDRHDCLCLEKHLGPDNRKSVFTWHFERTKDDIMSLIVSVQWDAVASEFKDRLVNWRRVRRSTRPSGEGHRGDGSTNQQ